MIILLLGPQGSGKGTEGKFLAPELNLPLIGVGELLRNVDKSHEKHSLIHEKLDKGELVDYETTAEFIKKRVSEADCANGYILDGWGRTLEQMPFFDPKPDVALYFNVPLEETIKRISGRRICKSNGEILNIYTMTPEKLAQCWGDLAVRTDDTEEVVRKRQQLFETETIPVIEMYKKEGKLVEIDAVASPEEVHSRVLKALENRR